MLFRSQLELLEAARPRGPGSRERGPVLRMARQQQPPPWVHTAFLLCLLSLSGAIEIPMDRESCPILFDSPDLGQRSWEGMGGRRGVKTNFGRGWGEGK